MKYNTTVQNDGALPIAYARLANGKIATVDQLYKDRPLMMDISYITCTAAGDIKLVGSGGNEYIFCPSADLNIKFVESNDKVTPPNA